MPEDRRHTSTRTKIITNAQVQKCPHLMLMPEHYRQDGTCRCDDSAHTEMGEWGYRWNDETKRWVS